MNRTVCVVFVLLFLSVFAVSSIIVRGDSQVELTPTSGEPDDSVIVEGTDFVATKTVGIGFGAEANVTSEVVTATGPYDGDVGPYVESLSYWPIKPGSFQRESGIMIGDLYIHGYLYWDDGSGTILTDNAEVASATIEYTTGKVSFNFTSPLSSSYDYVRIVNYTRYQFNVTPAAGLTTDASGAFTVNITVPAIWNGTHAVTLIDDQGNMATSDFTVVGSDVIPEPLTIGAIVLLSSVASVVSFYWLRKKPINKMVKSS
jgi:hypothetical protein